ncbi:hypothetical protein [Serratia marcescens]|uniref:hypothetical protein n=1 Tax=Serratia marcescens TaxID=615 RepID=UPI000744FDF3|nr:hypothetical protein [Serratia marcescens]CUZ29526.1 Uncharacterised protein [Serratia marcescens]CVH72536.1 Uncharacterised protein [Serratia marcescens]
MKKNIYFLKEKAGEHVRIRVEYNGMSAIYQRVGDRAQRCYLGGRGNARQIKHMLREFIKSTKAVEE